MARRAVYGSKRSLTSDQKPETSVAPKTAMCRYTATAARRGWTTLKPHSPSSSAVPAASAAGTTRAGDRRESAAEKPSTASAETRAEAIIMSGSEETRKVERKSASRVALPATCCAISAPAASVAAAAARL